MELNEIYSTKQAQDFLGFGAGKIRDAIYRRNLIEPIRLGDSGNGREGRSNAFTRRMLNELKERLAAESCHGEPIRATAEELACIVTVTQIAAELGKSVQSVRQHIAATQNVPGVKIGTMWVSTRPLVEAVTSSLRKRG